MSEPVIRCGWCLKDELYTRYHDEEWGVPVHSDSKLFEYLILESFQAGLSWHTVLKKRENFRKAFAGFDAKRVSQFTDNDVKKLMLDSGIIRHRLKILAAINNAKLFLKIQAEYGSFNSFIWKFTENRTLVNYPKKLSDLKSRSAESDAMSKELARLGFKFVGTTICYAFMQAIGMVNDHLIDCFARKSG
ncbi:MAG: DNA-3-methyladenine glycosylase I, partial [Bacteroidota bacterium]